MALLELVIPVNQALGANVMISSVPANTGIQFALVVTMVALAVACAALVPIPINTVTRPALRMRY